MGLNFRIGPDISLDSRVFYLLSILVGVALVIYGGMQYLEAGERIDDPAVVNATVEDTSIEEDRNSRRRGVDIEYDVNLEFSYSYDGVEYESERFYPTGAEVSRQTREGAEEVLENYEEGEKVKAYLDPDSPGEAFLRKNRSRRPIVLVLFGVAFLGISAWNLLNPD